MENKKMVSPGSFMYFGTRRRGDGVEFTFEQKTKKPAAILLYDRKTKALVEEVEIRPEYRMGRVDSCLLTGYDWDNLCYRIRRDGAVENDENATVIVGREKWNDPDRAAASFEVYCGFPSEEYKWTDEAYRRPTSSELILYKLHMRGFTMNSGLSAKKAGNIAGFMERIDRVLDMGVTAIEFMPLYDFEEVSYTRTYVYDGSRSENVTEPTGKINYWGYGNAFYYAPKASYFGDKPDISMKAMVDMLHSRGIAVVMEMTFDERFTSDYEIVNNLRYWVREYHIDGFHLLGARLPLQMIAEDPFLADTYLFNDGFEPELLNREKDAKRLFIYDDQFLYPLRKLQNHMEGRMSELAAATRRCNPHFGYVNNAANTTGFCLYDVYSYGEKHNEANGEENRDGSNYNYSYNYGVEGPSRSRKLDAIRKKSVRTALASVLLAQGVPMILAGDEYLNTQQGNNNPYCQDNDISWVNFRNNKSREETRALVKALITFRKAHPVLSLDTPMHMNDYRQTGLPDLSYHAYEPWVMGIGPEKKSIGMLYCGAYGDGENTDDIMVCYNFHYEEDYFALPRLSGRKKWHLWLNTASEEIPDEKDLPVFEGENGEVTVPGGSITILIGR